MRSAVPSNEREIGRVTAVSNFRVTISLDPDVRSPVRAYPHHIATVTQVGGYVLFPVTPGEHVVGIIVGAYENEAIEPDEATGMTLQLVRARRLLRVNLLGQLREQQAFLPGVSQYPPLESPALLPTDEELKRILEFRPRPDETKRDIPLPLGLSPLYTRQFVTASFNDLLGRPLGIVGNTGSGKSYSVASMIQSALGAGDGSARHAKFIILDINGEYSRAFPPPAGSKPPPPRTLNTASINGVRFALPLWCFNLAEQVAFFEASEASQVPVLERVLTSVREKGVDPEPARKLRQIVHLLDRCRDCLSELMVLANEMNGTAVCDNAAEVAAALEYYANGAAVVAGNDLKLPPQISQMPSYVSELRSAGLKTQAEYRALRKQKDWEGFPRMEPSLAEKVRRLVDDCEPALEIARNAAITKGGLTEVTADSPIPFDPAELDRDALFRQAVSRHRGQERIQEYIATLRLRIHRQLSDKRWSVFTSFEKVSFFEVLERLTGPQGERIVVVDCSALAHDVLPFFCAVFGRLVLELRQHAGLHARTVQPFALVLEEAHNYLRPHRDDESQGLRLAREAFERIAKEGRKFGLSLVIASQRPSDVSATVLSQCANFLIHRIQNPDDIEYFKKILPTGSRDVLDQLPILAPGDGLLLGSGVNVPARVRITLPDPHPESETPRPWEAWQRSKPRFDLEGAASAWVSPSLVSTASKRKDKEPPEAGTGE